MVIVIEGKNLAWRGHQTWGIGLQSTFNRRYSSITLLPIPTPISVWCSSPLFFSSSLYRASSFIVEGDIHSANPLTLLWRVRALVSHKVGERISFDILRWFRLATRLVPLVPIKPCDWPLPISIPFFFCALLLAIVRRVCTAPIRSSRSLSSFRFWIETRHPPESAWRP